MSGDTREPWERLGYPSREHYESTRAYDHRWRVLQEVNAERVRQGAKWGPQSHRLVPPMEDGRRPAGVAAYYGVRAEPVAKRFCDDEFRAGRGTYFVILLEEVCEAVEAACESEAAARAELIQVAAVAVAMIESIDRRASVAERVNAVVTHAGATAAAAEAPERPGRCDRCGGPPAPGSALCAPCETGMRDEIIEDLRATVAADERRIAALEEIARAWVAKAPLQCATCHRPATHLSEGRQFIRCGVCAVKLVEFGVPMIPMPTEALRARTAAMLGGGQ